MINNQTNLNILKILLWSANSLKQHKPELMNLLLKQQINISLVTETHRKQNTKLFFSGFKMYRTNHSNKTVHAKMVIIIFSKIQQQLFQIFSIPPFNQSIFG